MRADIRDPARNEARSRVWLGTLAIVGIYALVMICTNNRFTLLDDECDSIAIAGRPFAAALTPFFTGKGFHELHPPLAEILLHFWLVATHYSFFLLRVFANVFYIATIFFTARSAGKIAGTKAYWATLVLGFVWPFSFQYGRIAGWYSVSTFLLALATWSYLEILEDRGSRPWIVFCGASVLLVWSNYFGFAFLFLLLADLLIFHRSLALERTSSLRWVIAAVAATFLPLAPIAVHDIAFHVAPSAAGGNWKNAIAVAGYPSFALFGSAAIAPWFLPLSIPVAAAILVLLVTIWHSRGRRWLVYTAIAMAVLYLSGNLDIKRVPFILPWLFLAIGVVLRSRTSRFLQVALSAVAVIVIAGWIGIVSGRHYATANLHEPWNLVAKVVAQDARNGATIVSVNPPFFLYLDYQLGLEVDTGAADGSFLGEDVYRSLGYSIMQPDDWQTWADKLKGKVVLVNGTGVPKQVEEQTALNAALRSHCTDIGEYRAAPDPAALWKAEFVKGAPLLSYRIEVVWYDCPR